MLRCAFKHDFSTFASGARAYVYDVVGGKHDVFVVLHYDYGVRSIAQVGQCLDEASVVALVQPYGWFVKDIKYVDEFGTELCGQAYSLAFSAAECG